MTVTQTDAINFLFFNRSVSLENTRIHALITELSLHHYGVMSVLSLSSYP